MSAQVQSRGTYLFAPRVTWNLRYNAGFGGAESVRAPSGDPQYPQSGAMIDYWLPSNSGPVTLEITAPGGTLIRKLSSETASPDSSREVSPATGAQRLTKLAGLNRITWNTQYPGPWDLSGRRRGSQGPSAPPGTYTLKLTANGIAQTRSLNLRADPRVTADGVTTAILREQLAHNLRVRDLVSDANRAVFDLSAMKKTASGAKRDSVEALERVLLTPPVRYSRPGLQAQIGYLYGAATGQDQKVGRDAIIRYQALRKEMDVVMKRIAALR